jgi:hypothetical protein
MTASPAAERLSTEDGIVLAVFKTSAAAVAADEAAGVVYGTPDAGKIARRAALGGTDSLSLSVAAIAGRMWDQTGRRGFRGSIIRWRIAALIVIRWLIGGWLRALVPACPLWYLRLVAIRAETPAVPPEFRCPLTSRMTAGP